MSESPTPQTTTSSSQEAPLRDAPTPASVTGTDWKAQARKWEKRAKTANEQVSELRDQLADAAKRQEEAVQAATTPLTQRLAALEAGEKHRVLVERVAKESGVPARVLRGETAEELEAHAKALAPLLVKPEVTPVVEGVERTPPHGASSEALKCVRELFTTK